MTPNVAVIPTYMTKGEDLEMVMVTISSFYKTVDEGQVELMVVDDGSPDRELVAVLNEHAVRCGFEFVDKGENEGFSRTVNVGLKRALENGQNAVLVNADIEFFEPGWLGRMERQERQDGEGLASVVGGLLLFPNGTIQHAGVYFSLLHRWFDHIYKYGPGDLPEAQHARQCPVTGALQFIRHECLEGIGVYDPGFLLGWEDVDYCIRAWKSGREVVYQPTVRAVHHESVFRGRPTPRLQEMQSKSWFYFAHKWRDQSFAEFVPGIV